MGRQGLSLEQGFAAGVGIVFGAWVGGKGVELAQKHVTLENLGRLADALSQVGRYTNPEAFDSYVIGEMRRLDLWAGLRFWNSLGLTEEEQARIATKMFLPRPVPAPRLCKRCGRPLGTKTNPHPCKAKTLLPPAKTVTPLPPKSLEERAREILADIRRANPGMKESEAKAFFKPLIIEAFRPAKKEKPKKEQRHVTPAPARERIWLAWRTLQAKKLDCAPEDLSSLDDRARITRDEWMTLVRTEYPGSNWDFVRGVRAEIYEHNRSKSRKD